jgi:hypothetical protein
MGIMRGWRYTEGCCSGVSLYEIRTTEHNVENISYSVHVE